VTKREKQPAVYLTKQTDNRSGQTLMKDK
jgi:hypothetical protein